MRFVAIVIIFCALPISLTPLRTWAADEKALDSTTLAALQAKAAQAPPKDQCFLYAELVHQMTELAGREYNDGKVSDASATLMAVQGYTEKIRAIAAADSKKLKDAELLMQHTSFRLKAILESASYEDRPAVDATLKDLEQVQNQLMMEVFQR